MLTTRQSLATTLGVSGAKRYAMETCSDCGKHASHENSQGHKENRAIPKDWSCSSCVERQNRSSVDGKLELAHLQTALKSSHNAQALANQIGLDSSNFDAHRYPVCHVFHSYSGYALTSAMVALVRYGADSDENFTIFFGTTPNRSTCLNRVYGDALASTSRFHFATKNLSVLRPTPKATSPTHPQALWCDDEPYQPRDNGWAPLCGDPNSKHFGFTKQKHSQQVQVLLPAMYNMCGRQYIKSHKPRRRQASKSVTTTNVKATKTKVVRRILAETQNLAKATAGRFPPLPKHLTRGTDQRYTPPNKATFPIAVSSVTGTIFTGAVADTRPMPKVVLDGAHDNDDRFITCVF